MPTRRHFLAAALLTGTRALAQTPGTPKADEIKLPARAVTRGPKHHWFGYYDKCPWDATGRYLLAHENDYAARMPKPGDAITVGMADLQDGDRFVPLGKTAAWNWQQGAMLQWLGSAPGSEVVFNTAENGRPGGRILNVRTGTSRELPVPVYALSPDGTRAVTLDFARLHRLRPGYGYVSVPERFADQLAPKELGVWAFALADARPELVVSLAELAAFKPDARFKNAEHWVNHLQFSPGGTRVVFLHRFKSPAARGWATRLYTMKPDGSDRRLHLDTGMVSHFDWRDDRTLLAWCKTPARGNHFATIDIVTNEVNLVGDGVLTEDGHCSYSPDRKWILNDTYPDKDRLQWLMLFDPATGRRYDLNQFKSPKQYTGPVRCDLHPRWNRDGTRVCFDGCHGPTRQVYVVDAREVVGGRR